MILLNNNNNNINKKLCKSEINKYKHIFNGKNLEFIYNEITNNNNINEYKLISGYLCCIDILNKNKKYIKKNDYNIIISTLITDINYNYNNNINDYDKSFFPQVATLMHQ
tara:strand:+ start:1141 stop:1470 length:330 start_codon:yes stop_codon:yes gene_type:complete